MSPILLIKKLRFKYLSICSLSSLPECLLSTQLCLLYGCGGEQVELRFLLFLGSSLSLKKLLPGVPGYASLCQYLLWTSGARIFWGCCFSPQWGPGILVNLPHFSFLGLPISLKYRWDSHLIPSSGGLPYSPHFGNSPLSLPAEPSTTFCVLHWGLTGLLGNLPARWELKLFYLMW